MKKLFFTLLILLFALPAYAQQCSEPVELARLIGPVVGSVPSAGGVGEGTVYTFVDGISGDDYHTSGFTVSAGNLLVVYVKWEGSGDITGVTHSTDTLTLGTPVHHSSDDLHGCFAWKVSSGIIGEDITATFSGTTTFRFISAMVFSTVGTPTLDQEHSGSGTTTGSNNTIATGNITTTKTTDLVVTGYSAYSDDVTVTRQIGGSAGVSYPTGTQTNVAWYRIMTTQLVAGHGNCNMVDSGNDWLLTLISFK